MSYASLGEISAPSTSGETSTLSDDSSHRIPARPVDCGPLKILVAEDDPASRKVAAGLLRKHGHQITTVKNGQLALDRLKSEAFDIVLLDVHMPELNGHDTVHLWREWERSQELDLAHRSGLPPCNNSRR